MATYAIGDIQGCYQTLIKLLNKIDFQPEKDQLWLAGDMINRGKDSLKTLEFILQNQSSIISVLGNHDLHFLAVESGAHLVRPKDTFSEIFNSPLRKKIVKWLVKQPLFHRDKTLKFIMSHAGIYPGWKLKEAEQYAKEVSKVIQSKEAIEFYFAMYGNTPSRWKDSLKGMSRLRFITNALTRMRFCYPDLRLNLDAKSAPGRQPAALKPWFELIDSPSKYRVLFGHWASLEGNCSKKGFYALDTGCVWGGQLSALRLEDRRWFRVKSVETISN